MKSYRITGNDNNVYSGGGIFSPITLTVIKAKSPKDAIRKFYNKSKKHSWGWKLGELSARLKEVK